MENFEKIQEGIRLFVEGLSGTFADVAEQFCKAYKNLVESVDPILKKKLTKKKFCKLLQSHNIQRNEINMIIRYNKRPYNYKFLNEILETRRDEIC